MEQVNPRARSDQYGSRINRSHSFILVNTVPALSIIIASFLTTIPLASAVPVLPPLGLMLLLGWRIVRRGLLPVWVGLPLGAFDDLFSGQPFGSAVMLWSLAMIVIEIIEARFPWRTFVQDWGIICIILAVYLIVAALFSGAPVRLPGFVALGPQWLISVMLFPIMARLVARLDRLRLTRFKVVG